jgi:hypothetical protein
MLAADWTAQLASERMAELRRQAEHQRLVRLARARRGGIGGVWRGWRTQAEPGVAFRRASEGVAQGARTERDVSGAGQPRVVEQAEAATD